MPPEGCQVPPEGCQVPPEGCREPPEGCQGCHLVAEGCHLAVEGFPWAPAAVEARLLLETALRCALPVGLLRSGADPVFRLVVMMYSDRI